jgi:hypothetical protein
MALGRLRWDDANAFGLPFRLRMIGSGVGKRSSSEGTEDEEGLSVSNSLNAVDSGVRSEDIPIVAHSGNDNWDINIAPTRFP